MKSKSIVCLFLLPSLSPLFLEARPNLFPSEFLDQVAEEVFLSPPKKEETEIRKRVEEKNQADLTRVRTNLKSALRAEGTREKLKSGDQKVKKTIETALEGIPNLGGFLWYDGEEVIYSFGDWSDLYADGLSLSKLRKEGQIPSFTYQKDQIYFFLRNGSGYFPVDFQFLGWESTFYVFGDDGSLRYSNDAKIDPSIRIADFRKNLESIKTKIPNCDTLHWNDLTLFIIPGETRPLYFVLFGLRIFLYGWAIYLAYLFLRASFPSIKKNLLHASPPRQ